MFVILWSIASYVAGTLCVLGFSSLSTQGVEETVAADAAKAAETAETADTAVEAPVEEAEAAEAPEAPEAAEEKAVGELQFNDISKATLQMKKVMEKRKHRKRVRTNADPVEPPAKPVPGYYIKGKNKNGKSTYIYYGKEPPFE